MDISRLKKVLSGLSVAAISVTQLNVAFAAYTDVPSGIWYEDAVSSFTDAGYLDASQTRFRGNDKANRAEFVKLIVELNGGILSTPPAVKSFDDVASSAWYYGYFEESGKEGWVRGDENCYGKRPCYARPAANINRAEAAALIVRAFALDATGDAAQFVDNPSGQWYTDAIQTAADHCVLQGDDSTGRVRPSDNMNRAEMVVMLHRVDQGLTYGVDCKSGAPSGAAAISSASATSSTMVMVDFTANVEQASAENIANYKIMAGSQTISISSAKMTGDKSVELMLGATLDGATTYTLTVSNVVTEMGDKISDSTSFKGYMAVPQGNGVLEVSVSSKNPVGDSVPKGGNAVTMLTLDLAASCDDSVQLEDITILHEGFGASSDIDGVYAAVNGARVSRKRTIDSKDQSASVHFKTPLVIPACKSVTLDLVADISSTATISSEHNLVVELPSDLVSNAKQVKGNFPVRGNTFRVASVTSGKITLSFQTVSPNSIKVGDKSASIGKFEVSNNSVEDATLYAMTLQQDGTLNDGDVVNIRIVRSDGTVLTNVAAQTSGDYVTLTFNPPFIVKQSDKISLTVLADIVGGAGETVKMNFEETSDIFAVGSLYGYGVNGQLYGMTIALPTNTATSVTVDAGQFTIEINGPAQQTYTRDQDDAVLANVVFTTGGEKIDMRKLFIAVQGSTSTGGNLSTANGTATDAISEVLENVTLKNTTTGRSIDGVRLTGSADAASVTGLTYQIYRFDDFTISGKENYQVLVDFIDNGAGVSPKSGDQFKILICGEPTQVSTGTNTAKCFSALISGGSTSYQMQIEGLSTGTAVNDVRPGGTVTGNTQRIATANLTIAQKATATADTAVKNSKNLNTFRFEGRAGEAKDVLLTKLIFKAASGSLNNGQNYTLWADTDQNGSVDTILEKGVSAQGTTVTFSKMTGGGFVIPKEKTVVFEVHTDIAGSLTNGWLQLMFSTADTYVEAEDVVRGSSLSGIKTDSVACASSTCEITVTTASAVALKLVNQGDLYVTKDTVSVRPHQLLGGTLGDTVLRLQFHAENEAIDVTDIQLTSSGGTATSVDRLELYKDGTTTPFATATTGGCGSDRTRTYYGTGSTNVNTNFSGTASAFCAKMQSQQLIVPKGGDVKILVRPRIKSDVDGATSNQTVQFFIDATAVSNNATGSGAIRARGYESSNNLTATDYDGSNEGEVFIGTSSSTATANTLFRGDRSVTVLSKIASITNANPDANGSPIQSGPLDMGQFKIAAAANVNSKNGLNKVVLSGVIFNVTATNVYVDSTTFVIYNKVNSTSTKGCSALTTAGAAVSTSVSGSFLVYCVGLNGSAINASIDQGTDATFVLRGTVTTPQITTAGSNLQVSLLNFDSISRTAFTPTGSHFEWIDSDNTTSTTFRWVEYTDSTIKSTSYQNT